MLLYTILQKKATRKTGEYRLLFPGSSIIMRKKEAYL